MTDENVCKWCHGEKWLYSDDGLQARRCVCLERMERDLFLGAEFEGCRHVISQLYQPRQDPETGETVGDRTVDNLFIKGAWETIRRHIKWALGGRHYYDGAFTFSMSSDERLLHIWLGDDHAKNRRKDDQEVINNIREASVQPDLFILRFGVQQTRNRAISSVMREVLAVRDYARKPTWVIEGSEPFVPGNDKSHWSPELEAMILRGFDVIDLGGDIEGERRVTRERRAAMDSQVEVTLEGPQSEVPSTEWAPEPTVFDDAGPLGQSDRKRPSARKPAKGGGGLPGL